MIKLTSEQEIKDDAMKIWNDGYKRWRLFSKLMYKYPKDSYSELLLRAELLMNHKTEESK